MVTAPSGQNKMPLDDRIVGLTNTSKSFKAPHKKFTGKYYLQNKIINFRYI